MAKGTLRVALAMLLVQALQISSAAGQQKKTAANAIPASKSHMPKLYFVQNDAPRELPLEKTQLATTKNECCWPRHRSQLRCSPHPESDRIVPL
jgi:hypothetical protein